MSDKFAEYSLREELLDNLEELNFHTMTPIQSIALPIALKGKDVIAQAKTGSGKTAVFGLTILNSLDLSDITIQSLILCPTRELAEQVAKEIRTLARMLPNVKVLTLCGGVAEIHQERSLSYGAHILVGTPGRVLRLLNKKVVAFGLINTLVLDEADRMLDMGFIGDITEIISHLPTKRQSMLFSATYPLEIKDLGQSVLNDPIEVKVDIEHEQSRISQIFYEVERHQDKSQALLKVLALHRPDRLIVFCKTKQITDDLAKLLQKNGIFAEGIHGDLQQNERTSVLTKFANRSLSVLVATDVAARGLDISDLTAVVNFDLPSDPEVYIHRIGRTGRAGLTGQAFSFFIKKNSYRLTNIEEYVGSKCDIVKIEDVSDGQPYNLTPPMRTMYVGGGKRNKLRPGDILGALVGEAKLSPDDVGNIAIFNILSYVAIKADRLDQAISKLRAGKIKNKKFKVGPA